MKNSVFKRYIALIFVIALQLTTVSLSAINTQQISDLAERFNVIKKAYQDFRNAGKAYDDCMQTNCREQLQALTKITNDLNTVKWTDLVLKQVLLNSKLAAEESLQNCITQKCQEKKDRYEQAARKHVALVGVLVAFLSAPPLILLSVYAKRRAKKQKAIVAGLIEKYNIHEDQEARTILTDFQKGTFNKRRLLRLTGPLLKAMATISYDNDSEEAVKRVIEDISANSQIPINSLNDALMKEEQEAEISLA